MGIISKGHYDRRRLPSEALAEAPKQPRRFCERRMESNASLSNTKNLIEDTGVLRFRYVCLRAPISLCTRSRTADKNAAAVSTNAKGITVWQKQCRAAHAFPLSQYGQCRHALAFYLRKPKTRSCAMFANAGNHPCHQLQPLHAAPDHASIKCQTWQSDEKFH